MTKKLTYLACPYSHCDSVIRHARFEASNRAAALLMKAGHFVFSPLSHTHPIAAEGDLPLGWDYWKDFDEVYLSMTGLIVVLTLEGWQDSTGVMGELEIAGKLEIDVTYTSEKLLKEGNIPPIPGFSRREWENWQFEQSLAQLTEDDAGFQNFRRERAKYPGALGNPSLEVYKASLRQNERDCQQMVDMGR